MSIAIASYDSKFNFGPILTEANQPLPSTTCSQCGHELSRSKTDGLCPRCVFSQVVSNISADDHPALRPIAVIGRCPSVEQLNVEIPGFTFERILGRGGSGWTFLATQNSLARDVAVKIMPRKLRTQDSEKRFRREAENLAKLNHPNIVTAFDFGSTENYHYIVMEFVDGPTLGNQLQIQKLSTSQAINVAKQICDAVVYAHQKGLMHRDIKPENVLVVGGSVDSAVKVADFGIAKLANRNQTRDQMTAAGMMIGTPFYMAPEQNMTSDIDFRADIFSIGVLFYEMLSGRLPIGRFRRPSSFGHENTNLDAIVFKALANDPSDRFQTARQFRDALDRCEQAQPNTKRLVMGSAVVATVAIAGLLTVFFNQRLGKSSDDFEENPFQAVVVPRPAEPLASQAQDTPPEKIWRPQLDQLVQAKWNQHWHDAKIIEVRENDLFVVSFDGWSDFHNETLPLDKIRQRPNKEE